MAKVEITTDRLPARPMGAVIEVTDEKAASLVAQGFAKLIEEDVAVAFKPRRARKGASE
jgi:hypothetical protein